MCAMYNSCIISFKENFLNIVSKTIKDYRSSMCSTDFLLQGTLFLIVHLP